MIRLTVKGREPEVLSELSRRGIPPMYYSETRSQFLPEFYTCDVVVLSEHRERVSDWFAEGDQWVGQGKGFPVGTVMYFSDGFGSDNSEKENETS